MVDSTGRTGSVEELLDGRCGTVLLSLLLEDTNKALAG
jgi:hypothetical protein